VRRVIDGIAVKEGVLRLQLAGRIASQLAG
jgi:hypothetical protein